MKQRMILMAWLLRMETGVETFLTKFLKSFFIFVKSETRISYRLVSYKKKMVYFSWWYTNT